MKLAAFRRTEEPDGTRRVGLVVGDRSRWWLHPFPEGTDLVARRNTVELYRFRVTDDGRVVGRSGYHAGEEMHVVRRPDGTVRHLDVATFIYTRTPYDPDAPIPGS